MTYVNYLRNDIKNQIISLDYNNRLNSPINIDNIETLVSRSIVKGYFDNVYFYKLLEKSYMGFNNIYFYHNKKDNSLRASFIYNNSKYNIIGYELLNTNICVSCFNNFIKNNEWIKNKYLYSFVNKNGKKLYKINKNVSKDTIEYILNMYKVKLNLFFKLVNENFKKMKFMKLGIND